MTLVKLKNETNALIWASRAGATNSRHINEVHKAYKLYAPKAKRAKKSKKK